MMEKFSDGGRLRLNSTERRQRSARVDDSWVASGLLIGPSAGSSASASLCDAAIRGDKMIR